MTEPYSRDKEAATPEPTDLLTQKQISDAAAILNKINNRDKHIPIGRGRGIRDRIYHLLRFFQYSWPRRILPPQLRRYVYLTLNYMIQADDVKRNKSYEKDSLYDFIVPPSESVSVPGVWVVEYFTPSSIDSLRKAIRKNGWNFPDFSLYPNAATLSEARNSGEAVRWWRVAEISNIKIGVSIPGTHRQELPKQFSRAEIIAVAVGPSLTAIVCKFVPTEEAVAALNQVWHRNYAAALSTLNGMTVAQGSEFISYRKTQTVRYELHTAAREWMQSHCAGIFGAMKSANPTMDLLLLDKFDPISDSEGISNNRTWLRRLGLMRSDPHWITSRQIPGVLFEATDTIMTPTLKHPQTYTLWGQTSKACEQIANWSSAGSTQADAVGNHYFHRISNTLVRIGLGDYLRLLRRLSAEQRDHARVQHDRFKTKGLRKLRESILTTSMDISSTVRDCIDYDEEVSPFRNEELFFTMNYTPWQQERGKEFGHLEYDPIDFSKHLRKRRLRTAAELEANDAINRDILSTVSSIGSSIDSYRVQRYSIIVALISLIVAALSMWLTLKGADGSQRILHEWWVFLAGHDQTR